MLLNRVSEAARKLVVTERVENNRADPDKSFIPFQSFDGINNHHGYSFGLGLIDKNKKTFTGTASSKT